MIARRLLAVLVLALSVPLPGAAAAAGPGRHDPPPVYLEFDVKDGHLSYELLLWAQLCEEWLGLDWRDIEADPQAVVAERGAAILDWVARNGPVRVDGIEVRPLLEKVSTNLNDVQNVVFKMRVPLLAPPRSVEVRWMHFDLGEGMILPEVRSFFFHGDDLSVLRFTSDEPAYTWHAPLPGADADAPRVIAPADLWQPPARPEITVPALAVALVVLGGAAAVVCALKGGSLLVVGLVLALALGAGAATARIGLVVIPYGEAEGPDIPDEAEAAAIFEALHANVYRAFDYDDPEAVYDALSRSVTDDLLDRIYTEVYRGLIMQEEGGAVARAQAVRILELELERLDAEKEARFAVVCRWRVRGMVEHFGHKHLRTIEYRARYEVVRRGGAWRIADMQTLAQERIPDDEQGDER